MSRQSPTEVERHSAGGCVAAARKEPVAMVAFATVAEVAAQTIDNDHDGVGPIEFRRLLRSDTFAGPVDFVDFTIIPPASSIGVHTHRDSEEAYLIASGEPLVEVNGVRRRLGPGAVAVVRSGQSHGLLNDTTAAVTIFVFQVNLRGQAHDDAW